MDPIAIQCCETIQLFYNSVVYQNEKNALKMISTHGSFLFMLSQQIMGWKPPIDMVLRLACSGTDETQKDETSTLQKKPEVEISELENVLIHAITPSNIRQILEQMYLMHRNNHPSSIYLLSMLELLCKSSGKAKKFFQPVLVRLLLPQTDQITQAKELHSSVLFKLSLEEEGDNEEARPPRWRVTFRSNDSAPTTSMSNLMTEKSIVEGLQAEAEGISTLFDKYDQVDDSIDNNSLAIQQAYELLEDLGFGKYKFYQFFSSSS
jgi:hypothetical protein